MYNVITLKNGSSEAKVNLSLGANLISLNIKDKKILREPDYSKPLDNPFLYGMPILFPVNRIEGGSFRFEGREYNFPINEEKTNCHLHGSLHKTPFVIDSLSKNRVVCKYSATANAPYLSFPHEFMIFVEYKLNKNSISIKTTVKNNSNLNMPIFLGYHTTFNVNDNSLIKVGAKFEIERNMKNYLPTGRLPGFDGISNSLINGEFVPTTSKISKHYKSKKFGKMVIFDKTSNESVEYFNSNNLSFRLIYGDGTSYICLEPQTCMANCQNAPFDRNFSGFSFIKPHKKKVYLSKIKLSKGDKR